MDWQGRRKGKYSGKRERCDGVATELRVFTSHVQLSVAGAPGTRTRLGRKASFPLSPPTSQKNVISTVTVFTLSRTSSIEKCSN